jgi:DnaK suppressor protein
MTISSNTVSGPLRDGQARHRVLQAMLLERQRELQGVFQRRVRQAPAERPAGAIDDTEQAEADVQEDIEVALIQMKGEALARVRDALARLESGDYGNCVDCSGEIAEGRLRAVPFAVRCTPCEEAREQALAVERRSEARQRFSTTWASQSAF